MIKNGVLPNRKDHRDYSYHRTFGSVILSRIPDEFDFDVHLTMPDQNADGLYQACTSYTHTDIYTDETKQLSSPLELYKKTMEVLGIKSTDSRYLKVPSDIRHALKAAQQLLGFPSYFDVLDNKPFDTFDTIRMVMSSESKPVTVGTPWLKEWESPQNGIITEVFIYDESAAWHCYKFSGVKKINGVLYLIAKSWQGKNYGDGGLVYFPRSVVNKAFGIGGTFAYTLATPPVNEGDIKPVTLPWWQDLLSRLAIFIKSLNPQPVDAPQAIVEQVPEPPLPVPVIVAQPEVLLWDNPLNVRHSIRLMCDAANLPYDQKNDLCACIQQESQFNIKAIGKVNRDGTQDFGLAQFNNGKNKLGEPYWIGPGADFANAEEVLNDPEKNVRVMIREFKAGHQNYWSSYKTGAYKQWL